MSETDVQTTPRPPQRPQNPRASIGAILGVIIYLVIFVFGISFVLKILDLLFSLKIRSYMPLTVAEPSPGAFFWSSVIASFPAYFFGSMICLAVGGPKIVKTMLIVCLVLTALYCLTLVNAVGGSKIAVSQGISTLVGNAIAFGVLLREAIKEAKRSRVT